jgi:iron complex outermembrane receptor protein
MLRRKVLSLVTVLMSVFASGLAVAQDATTPPPAAPPAAEPAPATPPSDVVVGDQPAAAAPAGQDEKTEEIVVTGTRIRRKDLTTPAPVAIINREAIQAAGKISIGDFLQALPEQGNALNTQVNNGNDGSVRVNLRSLGSNRTLVLVNGRRMVNGGTGADSSPDLNTIPAAAVERIEILKDGASAVYGSDAISGVVNVILKKRFSGTEISAYTGTSSRGDGTTYDVSATTGTGSERGNILFSLGYQEQKKVIAGDRSWAETAYDYDWETGERIATGNSSTFPEGRFAIPVVRNSAGEITGCTPGVTDPDYLALCNIAIEEQSANFVPRAGAPNGYELYDNSLYNTNPTNFLITPNRRIQLFATGDTNLGDVARGFFEASYVNRASSQDLAAMPVVNNTIPTKPVSVDAASIYNPFGVNITSWRRRVVEFGDRRWSQDLDTFHIVTGLDGQFGDWASLLRGWNWEVSYNYGRTAGTEVNSGLLRMPNVANATGPSRDPDGSVAAGLGATGDEVCLTRRDVPGDPAPIIPGCVPWDVLHGVPAPGPGLDALKSYLSFNGTLRGFNRQEVYSANIGGDLFNLLSDRPIALAAGVDYRKESGEYLPDVITASLESSGNNVLPTSGGYNVKEAYGELSVPIIGNLPYAEDLEASIAARVVDYSTFGTNTTYKFGARWSPFRDVSLRGTVSTAFRAPNIGELFGGATDSYPSLRDPCRAPAPGSALQAQCVATGVPAAGSGDPATQILEKWLGTPDLKPEEADVYTVGLVLQPRWVPNLSATIDYYNITVDDAIALTGAGTILSGCYPGAGGTPDPAMCDLVIRGPDGRILNINDPRTNRNKFETAGLDFALRYALPTAAYGRFSFQFDGTLLQYYRQIDQVTGERQSFRNNYDYGGPNPRFKANVGVGWGLGGFGLGVTTRYVGAYEECFSDGTALCSVEGGEDTGVREVSSYMPVDAYVTYALRSSAGRTSVALGMTNVLDTRPPYVWSALSANSDPGTYDYLGRFAYVRLTHGF